MIPINLSAAQRVGYICIGSVYVFSSKLSVEGHPWHASESLAHHTLYSRSRTLDLTNNPSGSYIPHPPPTFSILRH